MKEIIKRIFIEKGFTNYESINTKEEDLFFFGNLNADKINFYIVIFRKNIDNDFLEEIVPELYDSIKRLQDDYDSRMDKNLSMLVCLENKMEGNNEELMKNIFNIEEDPYFFKKNVFVYNREQEKLLRNLFSDKKNISSESILNEIINNTQKFVDFKNQPDEINNSLYGVCSRLLIKLPFLIYKREKRQIESLSKNINSQLLDKGLSAFSEQLLKIDENDEANLIKNILL
jgi:hypothetical protein